MSRRTQLLILVPLIVGITSGISHLFARVAGFRTEAVTPLMFGASGLRTNAAAAGSSLMFYGINWSEVSKALGVRIRGWAVPGGSVEEMEVLQRVVSPTGYSFLDVSINDLNNNYLSEFHANVVPFRESIAGLVTSHAELSHARRVLSQYPLAYLRFLYPTAGRSTHVMVAVRTALRSLRPRSAAEPSDRALLGNESNTHTENITEWTPARMERQLADARYGLTSRYEFHGTKRDALFRFLRRGAAQGKMIVLVIPESQTYRREFVTPDVLRRFDAILAEARERTPEALWIRLDTVSALQSDTKYWDLVHLNAQGQASATEALISQLKAAGVAR